MASIVLVALGCTEAGAPAPGEPLVCTDVGGVDGVRVELVPDAPVPAGHYAISAAADGVVLTTPIELLDDAGFGVCPGLCTVQARAGARTLVLASTLHWLGGDATVSYLDGGGPAEVTLTVRRDGVAFAAQTFRPTYELRQPNGPDCPGAYAYAHATMALPAP